MRSGMLSSIAAEADTLAVATEGTEDMLVPLVVGVGAVCEASGGIVDANGRSTVLQGSLTRTGKPSSERASARSVVAMLIGEEGTRFAWIWRLA
jgi:hypothetical protein